MKRRGNFEEEEILLKENLRERHYREALQRDCYYRKEMKCSQINWHLHIVDLFVTESIYTLHRCPQQSLTMLWNVGRGPHFFTFIIPRHEVEGGYRNGCCPSVLPSFRPSVLPSFRPSVLPSVRHVSFPEQNTKTVRDILTKLGT